MALAVGLFVGCLPLAHTSAAVVSWGFNGVIGSVNNPSNAVPVLITPGTRFSGTVTYDPNDLNWGDANPSPNKGDYYFSNPAAFSITMSVSGVTFTSTNRVPSEVFAGINISNDIQNRYDDLTFWTGSAPLINGVPPPAGVTQGGFEIGFQDNNKTAFKSDAIPMTPPDVAAYTGITFTVSASSPGAPDSYFYIDGEVLEVTAISKVILTLQRLPGNRVRLSWPVSAKDLTLQFATGLQPQNWKSETTAVVNTATEHTVTVSSDGQLKLFRLVKLPL
jgi:hypothetical protein